MDWIEKGLEQIEEFERNRERRMQLIENPRIDWVKFQSLGGDIEELYREAIKHHDYSLAKKASRALKRHG